VIDVPTPLGLRPEGVQDAPTALRRAGLHAALGSPQHLGVDVPAYDAERPDDTGILNGPSIAAVARDVAAAVEEALEEARFPVVLGGDCSVLLGPLLALRRRGRFGLVFIDGHADFQHPSQEEHGEAASLDLALATGRGPAILADLDGLGPLVHDEDVALLGLRAVGDNDRFLDEDVTDTAIAVIGRDEIAGRGTARAIERVHERLESAALEGFWVHFDVDALDSEAMPAVDYRVPGGLDWAEAAALLGGILSMPGAVGVEMTIFNPRLDPTGTLAGRLAKLLAGCVLGR
jgi:arginase